MIENQYSAWGVWVTNANLTGELENHHTGDLFATNTNAYATSTDTGLGYDPAMGNILHAYGDLYTPGWQEENGDPALHLHFNRPITSIDVDFIGDLEEASMMLIYDGADEIAHVDIPRHGGIAQVNATLSYSSLSPFDTVMLGMGTRTDWVGVDNIRFTFAPSVAVPESGTVALFASTLTLGGTIFCRKKTQKS